LATSQKITGLKYSKSIATVFLFLSVLGQQAKPPKLMGPK